MRFLSFAFLLTLIAAAQGIAVYSHHVVHEKRVAVSSKKWVKRKKLSPTAILPMRIGLSQRNLENGYDFLMDM
jgi:tripeptidyl-peptidase-1